MKDQKVFKLVDGSFTPEEAAEVLFALIGDKIRFHNIQVLSLEERFGRDTTHSKNRLRSLKQTREQVKELIQHAAREGMKLQIQGNIEITLDGNALPSEVSGKLETANRI